MAQNTSKPRRGRPPIYPWREWLRPGITVVLEKGVHFECETRSFELLARRQAKRYGVRASVSGRDESVTIKVA